MFTTECTMRLKNVKFLGLGARHVRSAKPRVRTADRTRRRVWTVYHHVPALCLLCSRHFTPDLCWYANQCLWKSFESIFVFIILYLANNA